MPTSSSFGILAFVLALIAVGMRLASNLSAWRSREMLVPMALLLITLHWVVPLSDRVDSLLALLAALIVTYALRDQSRRGNAQPEGHLIRTDLRNIMTAQEAYRRDHGGYATTWEMLLGATGIPLTPGNIAEIFGEPSGYRAIVRTDESSPEPARYSVYVGSAADAAGKPPLTIIEES